MTVPYLTKPAGTAHKPRMMGTRRAVAGAMVVLWQLGYWLSIAPMVLYALGFGGVWLNQVMGALNGSEP